MRQGQIVTIGVLALVAVAAIPAAAQTKYDWQYGLTTPESPPAYQPYETPAQAAAAPSADQEYIERRLFYEQWSPNTETLAPIQPLTPSQGDYGYDTAPAYQ